MNEQDEKQFAAQKARLGEFQGIQPAREKTWGECDSVEKIERLRAELRILRNESRDFHELAGSSIAALGQHEHGANGKPMYIANAYANRGTIAHGYDPLK